MKVLIDPGIERLVREKIESGRYDSADAVVHEALLAFLKDDPKLSVRIRALRKEIDRGLNNIAHGKVAELDRSVIKRRGRSRLASTREK